MKQKCTLLVKHLAASTLKKAGIAFWLLCVAVSLTAQTLKPENKMSPAFRLLISNAARVKDSATLQKVPGQFRLTPAKVRVPGRQALEERYDCIIYTTLPPQALREKGIIVQSVLPKFVTAWVTPEQIQQLAFSPEIKYIEAPRMAHPGNDLSVGATGASLLHNGRLNNTAYKGKGVIVCIFDSGIDWDHPDFRDPNDTTKSRILRIWDQTITADSGELVPAGFNYGVEYTQAQINDELDGTPVGFVRERDINGHGTHVAGTAAGNGAALPSRRYAGIAPEADIVIIKGGDYSFSFTNVINAFTYMKNLSTQLGRPVVVNMSIGTQYGAHDGTSPMEVAADNFSGPGRAVAIAAMNENGSYKHKRFALGSTATIPVTFSVPSDTTGGDVFAYCMYASDSSAINATLAAPDSSFVTAAAGQFITDSIMNKRFIVYLDNGIDPANNDRYVEFFIERNPAYTGADPVGKWQFSVTNATTNTPTIDGWLYYKNDYFYYTELVGSDNEYLVGSPGCATSAITAAAYSARNSWYSYAINQTGLWFNRMDEIASFSSHGPRRDGVLKPDIAAMGHVVISSLSSDAPPPYYPEDVVHPGKYLINAGTSMASPAVAGAVALLLQANPTATAAQLKNLLTGAAIKDVFTEQPGPTPNTTWGYGKMDVYKSMSSLFNCAPADRRTYRYDSSTLFSQETATNLNSQRIAVRFTPDITGKLGGIYFTTDESITSLYAEVRASNMDNPGTLLGTLNLDSSTIGKSTGNYFDLSSLNLSVAGGTDYFVVLGRTGTANWSLWGEAVGITGRTFQSTDGGNTWATLGINYRIRSVVYSNAQMTGPIATTNSANTRDINTSNQFLNSNCQLIAQLVPAGAAPVSGIVSANIWIEPGVPHAAGGDPFVARHYQLTPLVAASTGRVTLYFTQAEFTAFNNDAASTLDLPANPTDVAGKANLRIGKFPGSSSDGTGLPDTYPAGATLIDPADTAIIWNSDAGRWEVTFDVSGFSGFVVQTKITILPVIIEYFTGKKDNNTNVLNWKVACNSTATRFEVERSADGVRFSTIGSLSATQARCTQPFAFTDKSPLSGINYYRIKIMDASGNVYYTNVVLLQGDQILTSGLYPTYMMKGAAVQVSFAGNSGQLIVNDASGRLIYSHLLYTGVQSISISAPAGGVYFYKLVENNKKVVASGKMVVQ